MSGEKIEQIKRDYTDKLVLVDPSRPELARFRDVVGRVKTVNMNGRALVEFDEYHANIGWYDIAPEFLKVVDQPPPKPPKPEAKKAPAKKPGEPASAGGAKGGKPSVAEMLAAARSGGAAKAAAAPAAKAKAATAAKPAGGGADRSKMSVADMLAAARSGGAAGAAPKAAAPAADEAEEAPAATPAKAKAVPAKSAERVDKSKMTIDQMIAWCREHDTN